MTSSGAILSSASSAAGVLLKGWTSCPSERSSSDTICNIVISSSTRSTLAMRRTVKAFPCGSKRLPCSPDFADFAPPRLIPLGLPGCSPGSQAHLEGAETKNDRAFLFHPQFPALVHRVQPKVPQINLMVWGDSDQPLLHQPLLA